MPALFWERSRPLTATQGFYEGWPGRGNPGWCLPLPRLSESTSSEEALHVAEGDGLQCDVADLVDPVHPDAGGARTEKL